MKQKKDSFINIGFSSIVMVFIMICLVTFATLSVLTAHSDYRLSKKAADKTVAYYAADTLAREVLSEIDLALYERYKGNASAKDFFEDISTTLQINNLPQSVSDITIELTEEFPLISYQVAISDVQTLHVVLSVHYPQTDSEWFTSILKWQTVTVNEPSESDEYLNLYTGEK